MTRAKTEEAETLRRQRISAAKKGKPKSPEYRAMMSELKKKQYAAGEITHLLREHTPETRKKLSHATLKAYKEGRLTAEKNQQGLVLGRTRSTEERSAAWTPEKRAAQAEKTKAAFREGRVNPTGSYRNKWHIYDGPKGTINMRSKSETIFAQHLDFLNIDWQYEPQRFDLGWATYTPDFHLPQLDQWVEVKGQWTDISLRKFAQFQQTHRAFAVLAKDLLRSSKWLPV